MQPTTVIYRYHPRDTLCATKGVHGAKYHMVHYLKRYKAALVADVEASGYSQKRKCMHKVYIHKSNTCNYRYIANLGKRTMLLLYAL